MMPLVAVEVADPLVAAEVMGTLVAAEVVRELFTGKEEERDERHFDC